jgi:hypothetical protein
VLGSSVGTAPAFMEKVSIMRKIIGLAFVLGLLPNPANAAGPLGLW